MNQIVQMPKLSATGRHALRTRLIGTCLSAIGGFALVGLLGASPARAHCNAQPNPAAAPGVTANSDNAVFGADNPFHVLNEGLGGCGGADGGTDEDGAPGLPGQQAGSIDSAATNATVKGPSVSVPFEYSYGIDLSAAGGAGGAGGNGGEPVGNDVRGGAGGAAGAGADISFDFTGTIRADDNGILAATGIHVLTTGGIGGTGGSTDSAYMWAKSGGAGGAGGAGGTVKIAGSGDINVSAVAIEARAEGGKGGTGGSVPYTSDKINALLGGKGGAGGAGGNSSIAWYAGSIAASDGGLFATAEGGTGGSGGSTGNAAENKGGDGGDGGDGGHATVTMAGGSILLTDIGQPMDGAIVASASGGYGGPGGTANFAIGADGGSGGNGGAGGTASASVMGAIAVTGAGSNPSAGVYVNANGGGGGEGGGTASIVGESGAGGHAGVGGTASFTLGSATTAGDVQAKGDLATAALVQSIGGGGGEGGEADFGGQAGRGEGGGNGGTASADIVNGNLLANGASASALIVQSIGGSGGVGGNSTGGGGILEFLIGGRGAVGGDGGAVDVNLAGQARLASLDLLGDGTVLAQSIGGAGGAGGSATVESEALFTMAVGGKGGSGGSGGTVNVSSSAVIGSYGDHAAGIQAQSIGGGGGKGGAATIYGAQDVPTVSVAVGGDGGVGGVAGAASILNSGAVSTFGADAVGLVAQSIGGGGGSGGAAVARTASLMPVPLPAVSLAVAIGGNGGSGNHGGKASITNSGIAAVVTTANHGAHAMLAQSVGGGGGIGGDSTAGSFSAGSYSDLAISVDVAVGGGGGSGGDGGEADLKNSGLLVTMGADAFGMAAQSIGGGGGMGGGGDATATAASANSSYSADIAVGGKGGAGGHGQTAQAQNDGGITTGGDGSDGIFVQSVGGGGGAGGGGVGTASGDTLSISVGVGGSGGAGGNGGSAIAENKGAIVARGSDAAAIFVQSVGGGGGKAGKAAATAGGNTKVDLIKTLIESLEAGLNMGGTVNEVVEGLFEIAGLTEDIISSKEELEKILKQLEGGPPYDIGQVDNLDVAVSVGGSGGVAGDGGSATASNSGEITTFGAQSDGMFVQSVGGGGGKGGAASSTGSSSDDSRNQSAIAVGGGGGAGGDGGSVTAQNLAGGAILTRGVLGFGMVAQSVGGGGGIGGMTGTVAGSLFSLSVGVGGNGGAQGHGGDVHALNDGSIRTEAKHGIGILAQSVGGGGGIVRTMTTDHTYDPDLAPDNPQGRLGDLQGFSMSIGGKDNPSGDGGAVEVVNAGSIVTLGRTAHAVVAQSIGGGGGAAFGGQLVEGTSGTSQGGTGNGAAVSVSLHAGALVSTSGDGAYGILAQSIGGGGGLAGDFANVHNGAVGIVGGSIIAGSGNGGDVSVGMTGARITTTGRFAPGVFAQSIGGGGGLLSLNDALLFGTAGGSGSGGETVSVDLVGSSVSATGARSPGIMVQNDGSASGKSVISIDAKSSVTGGLDDSGLGHPSMAGAIFIVGGTGNNISNAGTISGIDGTSNAIAINIFGALDSTTITNSGTIIGDILTPGVGGTVQNMQGGLVDARGVIDLGSAGQFINSGTLEVGGAQRTTTTLLTGNLVQGDSGRLVFAADLASGVSDQLVVVGHAEIGGTVVVRPTSISNRSITLLTATEGVVLTPVSSVSETSFALYSFPVTVSGNSLVVTPQASFAGAAGQLGANHQAVAGHLQALFDGGASADAAFSRLSTISDAAAYETALDQVSGKALGAFGSFRFNSSRTFAGNLFGGCVQPQLQDRSTGRCGWAHALVSSATQDASADNLGYTADSHALQMGGQVPLSDTVALTGSLAYEGTTFRDGDARISGDTLMGGLGLLYAPGRLELSAGIDLAYGWYKSRRTIAVGSTSEAATARPEQSQFGGHLRAAYDLLPGDDSFVRPFVEGHAVRVSNKAFTEAGSSPFRLSVERQSDTALIGVAGVEFGTVFGLSGSMKLRPFASAAVEFGNDRAWTTSARFADQPQSDSFRQTTAGPGTLGRFSIGADLLGAKNVAFSLRYAPEFGKDFHSHSGTGTLTILF